jgi:serine/threonine protein kinase
MESSSSSSYSSSEEEEVVGNDSFSDTDSEESDDKIDAVTLNRIINANAPRMKIRERTLDLITDRIGTIPSREAPSVRGKLESFMMTKLSRPINSRANIVFPSDHSRILAEAGFCGYAVRRRELPPLPLSFQGPNAAEDDSHDRSSCNVEIERWQQIAALPIGEVLMISSGDRRRQEQQRESPQRIIVRTDASEYGTLERTRDAKKRGSTNAVEFYRNGDRGRGFVVKTHALAEVEDGKLYMNLEFLREACMMRYLGSHKQRNLVQLLGLIIPELTEEGPNRIESVRCGLVMPRYACDLRRFLKRPEWRPALQRNYVRYVHDILQGVAYLHSEDVIHRDLKPHNIFYDEQNDCMVIGDLGSAIPFGCAAFDRAQGRTALVTTLPYRAPEMMEGGKFYSHAVDIWSLGCVFYEMANPVSPRALLFPTSDGDEAKMRATISLLLLHRGTLGSRIREIHDEVMPGGRYGRPFWYRMVALCIKMDPHDRKSALDLLEDRAFSEQEGFQHSVPNTTCLATLVNRQVPLDEAAILNSYSVRLTKGRNSEAIILRGWQARSALLAGVLRVGSKVAASLISMSATVFILDRYVNAIMGSLNPKMTLGLVVGAAIVISSTLWDRYPLDPIEIAREIPSGGGSPDGGHVGTDELLSACHMLLKITGTDLLPGLNVLFVREYMARHYDKHADVDAGVQYLAEALAVLCQTSSSDYHFSLSPQKQALWGLYYATSYYDLKYENDDEFDSAVIRRDHPFVEALFETKPVTCLDRWVPRSSPLQKVLAKCSIPIETASPTLFDTPPPNHTTYDSSPPSSLANQGGTDYQFESTLPSF